MGMFNAAARHSHSYNLHFDSSMNKKKAISIITGAAKQYHEQPEGPKVLFAYK